MIVTEPGQQLHSQSSPGDMTVAEGQGNVKFSQNCKFGHRGRLGHSCVRVTKGQALWLPGQRSCDGLNVRSSAHNCGCVVNGGNTMAAI